MAAADCRAGWSRVSPSSSWAPSSSLPGAPCTPLDPLLGQGPGRAGVPWLRPIRAPLVAVFSGHVSRATKRITEGKHAFQSSRGMTSRGRRRGFPSPDTCGSWLQSQGSARTLSTCRSSSAGDPIRERPGSSGSPRTTGGTRGGGSTPRTADRAGPVGPWHRLAGGPEGGCPEAGARGHPELPGGGGPLGELRDP